LSPITNWKLSSGGAGDHGVGVRGEDFKVVLVVGDHEKEVNRETDGRNQGRVGTRAVRIHCIRAGLGYLENVAAMALDSSGRESAVSVEGLHEDNVE